MVVVVVVIIERSGIFDGRYAAWFPLEPAAFAEPAKGMLSDVDERLAAGVSRVTTAGVCRVVTAGVSRIVIGVAIVVRSSRRAAVAAVVAVVVVVALVVVLVLVAVMSSGLSFRVGEWFVFDGDDCLHLQRPSCTGPCSQSEKRC